MVFARKPDAALTSLVKQLDTVVSQHADADMKAFVNLIGSTDQEALGEAAAQVAEEAGAKHVPVCVPVESVNGPENFGVVPEAELTVILYTARSVVSNHAFAAGEFDEGDIPAILADVPKIVE